MKNLFFVLLCFLAGCKMAKNDFNHNDVVCQLDYSKSKVIDSLDKMDVNEGFPRTVKKGESAWATTGVGGWTSGFYPGLLWYLYEYSGDTVLLEKAQCYTARLEPIRKLAWNTHDLGFMMYCGVGNGFRVTGKPEYKEWLLQTADSLALLFNPKVGTTLSWPWMKKRKGWPHNTIIDNMLNLELLFWASKNGGNPDYYDMAVSHAQTTLKNHFRPDNSSYHLVVYDDKTGQVLQKITDQGFADESVWSRGQAWAIYGFAMCYRETGLTEFRDAAIGMADYFLTHLPDDYVPYWDFKLPDVNGEERDASAAAIAASGLIDLVKHLEDPKLKSKYLCAAGEILASLSSDGYISHNTMAILDHSVGSKPHDSEIDVPIIYADYYYVEALTRMLQLERQSD